jgi:hypothetical protein
VYCLNVTLNGRPLCAAAVEDATMVTALLGGSVFHEEPASLHVAGMRELPNGRSAHVYWLDETPLVLGDVLTFCPTQVSSVAAPLRVVPTDSSEYIEEQRQYDEFLSAHVWPQPQPLKRRANVLHTISMPGFPALQASLPLGHEHLLCSVSWNMWRPDRTRVSVRSFVGHSGEATMRKLEWLSANVQTGETLRVEVRA